MNECPHNNIRCLNEFELIRKYACKDCGAVMMCACDETVGRKFLAHQLGRGVELATQQRIPVTAGFQPHMCEACRGQPITPHPVAAIHGRTSKIQRYYWRELAFDTMERFDAWSRAHDPASRTAADTAKARKEIEKEVLTELKALHARSPKYAYSEETQAEIIEKYNVDVVALKAKYVADPENRGEIILDGETRCGVEEYASRYFRNLGYEVLFLESTPFHVLFGIYMWLVIQDSVDPRVQMVSFGDRNAFAAKAPIEPIWTHLPEDFGTTGYGARRTDAIRVHLAPEMFEPGELQWLFDYWLGPSEGLRQYLWAHTEEKVQAARRLIDILPPPAIRTILEYLTEAYWDRYLGWPDLLVFKGGEFFFAEVKSSGDKLGDKQKHWIKQNHERLHFPFKLVKVHKTA